MKDKEKQIEVKKLVNIITKVYPNKYSIEYPAKAIRLANELLERYQPKLPKDSVMLSMEEFKKLNTPRVYISQKYLTDKEVTEMLDKSMFSVIQDNSTIEMIPSRAEIERETAEKFYKKVRKLLKKVDIIVDGDEGLVGYEESAVDKGLTEISKQFGVEIKE